MLHAIIIDDEMHCIQTLHEKIKIYCPDIEVQNSFNKPTEALAYLQMHTPDVVFMDIEMPGMTGFALLEKLGVVQFKLVFTTAFDQFAVKAIKFSAFDYLLKPIDKNELIELSQKLAETKKTSEGNEQLQVLMQQLQNPQTDQVKISIPSANGIIFPYVKDIIRVESSSNYSMLFFADGKKITVSKTLKEFEDMLVQHHFYRVHNSHLINLKKITRYDKTDGGVIEMENGEIVEISRRRKDEFLKMIVTI